MAFTRGMVRMRMAALAFEGRKTAKAMVFTRFTIAAATTMLITEKEAGGLLWMRCLISLG